MRYFIRRFFVAQWRRIFKFYLTFPCIARMHYVLMAGGMTDHDVSGLELAECAICNDA